MSTGRRNALGTHAPCVLASHAPIAPRQRVVIPLELPSRRLSRRFTAGATIGTRKEDGTHDHRAERQHPYAAERA
jgi:hypothetical protein